MKSMSTTAIVDEWPALKFKGDWFLDAPLNGAAVNAVLRYMDDDGEHRVELPGWLMDKMLAAFRRK